MSKGVHVPTTVIDADGHVVEPLEAWTELPEDHRPLIHSDASGYEHVVVGGHEILAVPLGTLATPGATFADPSHYTSLAEAQPGGSDPVARLADMDLEGIDQAVLYPSIGLYFWALTDPTTATLVCHRLQRLAVRLLRRRSGSPVWRGHDSPARPGGGIAGAEKGGRATRIQSGLPATQSVHGPFTLGHRLRAGLGRRRGTRGANCRSRRKFGDRAHPGLGPTLQSSDPARRFACFRGDVGLRPTHGVRDPRASSRSAHRVPRIGRGLGALLARTPRRAVRDLRRFLPPDADASQ